MCVWMCCERHLAGGKGISVGWWLAAGGGGGGGERGERGKEIERRE